MTSTGPTGSGRRISRRTVLMATAATAGAVSNPGVAAATRSSGHPARGVALTHATVIDPSGGRMPDATVVLHGDEIVAVGPTRRTPVPVGATVVDLRGKFVLPGFADMHTHAFAERIDPALYVANGVTTVREMSGHPAVSGWRTRIEAGTLLGPRYTISSRIVDGAPSLWDPALLSVMEVVDAAQGRAAVRQAVAEGADFIKVYSRVPPEALRAIAAESRALGVRFVGHCPDAVPIAEAAELGQASFEHLFWTLFGTSSREAELHARLAEIRLGEGDYSGWFSAIHPLEMLAARTHDKARARELYEGFARHRNRVVPTLTMHHGLDNARTLDRNDPRNKYLPASIVAGMNYALDELYLKDRAPAEDAEWAALYEHRARLVGEMHRAGVPIMLGTDTGTCGMFPGFSVHDELKRLVDAGLSPREALRAATVEPARFLGVRSGQVAPGHAADLVVLDADPLRDIANTRQLSGVVVRGRYIGPEERTRILAEVASAAAETTAAVPVSGCPCHGRPVIRTP